MVLLLDCLKRRENWPEEFISALEECNHPTMAADIRREYDALRGSKWVSVLQKAARGAVKTSSVGAMTHVASSTIRTVTLSGLLHNDIRDAMI